MPGSVMEVDLTPKLLQGRIVQITEMGARIELKGKMGVIQFPLRSIFTDTSLALNDTVELYISYARVTS
jgi:hypothetical protein